jgi:PAS domain S-box-containing protein
MAEAVAALDWSRTPLGPAANWPASLSAAVSICLHSHFPMMVLWGPELVAIYNDAYAPILGNKHPATLGQPVAQMWDEIWPTIGPMLGGVMASGVATRGDDLLLSLMRRGFLEECYFTFSYSPIHAEGGATGGVFIAVLETTERVVNERRLKVLSALGARLPLARVQSHALQLMGEVLAGDLHSFPLAALYLADGTRSRLVPALCTGRTSGPALGPLDLADDPHPVAEAVRTGHSALVAADAVLPPGLVCGVWPEPPRQARVLPVQLPGQPQAAGALLLVADARRPLDADYRAFFDLVAGQVSAALANIEAMDAERRRVQALAQLDRAKSAFFANVSHELRTPVTLILGPLEEALDTAAAPLREPLRVVQRNALRLKKLVDSVLDLTRIESGRLLARPEPTDMAALTRETASLFRSAAEARGLQLTVHADDTLPLQAIDRDLWEQVLVNLLSNAIKCTHEGGIEVALAAEQGGFVLAVRDSGCGIEADELERLGQRFYRTRTAERLAIEGTGLGLALVHELVRLNGGRLDVLSTPGVGSVFRVSMPWRPAGAEAAAAGAPPVGAASRQRAKAAAAELLPAGAAREGAGELGTTPRAVAGRPAVKVLVVDDNHDLTAYIARLLAEHCAVTTLHDGAQALAVAREQRPDLLLADVMMPGLDGFALLRAIRAEQATRTMSVIMLSAHAGEEARLQALEAGADDYFVKPFNARELLARVRSLVQLVRLRREAVEREGELLRQIAAVEQDLEGMLDATQDAVAGFDRSLRCRFASPALARLFGTSRARLVGSSLAEIEPHAVGGPLEHALRRAAEGRVTTSVEQFHAPTGRWFHLRCYPTAQGVLALGADITEQRRVQEALRVAHAGLERTVADRTSELRNANELLAATFDRAPGGIAVLDLGGRYLRTNHALQRLLGRSAQDLASLPADAVTWPEDGLHKRALMTQLLRGERESFATEIRYVRPDGSLLWVSNFVSTISKGGRPWYFVSISQDISDRKQAEAEMLASQAELRGLYDRLQSVREEERLALAREVHDELGQLLSAAKIDIKLLEDDLRASTSLPSRRKLLAELRSARQTMDQAIESVRQVALRLRPPALDEQGLGAAIRWHARDFERRTRMQFAVEMAPGLREPDGAVATALFRIYQEAVTNVLRHARASRVEVSLGQRGEHLLLRVRDDGVGISRAQARGHRSLGITGMRERAAVCRGRLRVASLRGGGTLVSVRVPLHNGSAAASTRETA